MLQVALVGSTFDEASVFVSPLTGSEDDGFPLRLLVNGIHPWGLLGFACLVGDMTGSFFKRRRGLKREGDVSSKAPLLDTLPLQSWSPLGSTFLGFLSFSLK